MAEERLQFVLELATRATGDGAQRVAADMERVQRSVAATTDKAKVSEFAYYDLGKAIDSTRRHQDKIPESNNQVRVSSRNTSMALLELSRGYEDLQYGVRGILNNIPSLVLSLGGTAGLAGVISIAAVSLSQLSRLFGSVGGDANKAGVDVEGLAEKVSKLQTAALDRAQEKIVAADEKARSLIQTWDETTKADANYASASLSNAEKIREAGDAINTMLGIRIDRLQQLKQIEAEEAAKRALATQQQIEAEMRKAADAEQERALVAEELARRQAQKAADDEILRVRNQQLENLKLQKIAWQQLVLKETTAGGGTFGPGMGAGYSAPSQAGREASANLANPETENRIQALEDAIKILEKKQVEESNSITRAENALNKASSHAEDIKAAVEINVQGFQEILSADELKARSDSLIKTGEAFAKELESAFSKMETTSAQGEQARQALMAAAEDGKITANEMVGVAANLRTMIGLMQSGQEAQNANTIQLINLQKEFSARQTTMARDIEVLKRMQSQ